MMYKVLDYYISFHCICMRGKTRFLPLLCYLVECGLFTVSESLSLVWCLRKDECSKSEHASN